MFRIFKTDAPDGSVIERQATVPTAPRPKMKSAPVERLPSDPMNQAEISEYAALAETLGFIPPDFGVESFKSFLIRHDIPIFNLGEVCKYMDRKAAAEAVENGGWQWMPLREKDHRSMAFGRAAERVQIGSQWPGQGVPEIRKIASTDYYAGASDVTNHFNGQIYQFKRESPIKHYDHLVPLHALKKVALIEKEYKGDVAFFVSDYAPLPAVRVPDPFLMVVIPNDRVDSGHGRFVIDFWDEPGFGLEQMMK